MGNNLPLCYCERNPISLDSFGRQINTLRLLSDMDDPAFKNKNGNIVDINGTLRQPKGACVFLNIYHLALSNLTTEQYGFGVFHSGVEVYNEEYSFVGGPDCFHSILKTKPFDVSWMSNGRFQESLYVGRTLLTKSEIHILRTQWSQEQPCSSYDLLQNNCNHFSEGFIRVLTENHHYLLPEKITRIVHLGQNLRCCLPEALVDPLPPHAHLTAESRSKDFLERRKSTVDEGEKKKLLAGEPGFPAEPMSDNMNMKDQMKIREQMQLIERLRFKELKDRSIIKDE